MNRPDDALDPIVERADDRETWIGVKQGDEESREFDMAELQRLRAVVAAVEELCSKQRRLYGYVGNTTTVLVPLDEVVEALQAAA